MIDLRYVKKLIEMLDGSSVDSVEITGEKGTKIRISKSPQTRGAVQIPTAMPVPTLMAAAAPAGRLTPADAMPAVAEAEPAVAEAPKVILTDVKSPMVGTFYASPEPGAKAYAPVGSRVSKGQVLCIIEAMKIMNEIEAEVAGVVKEICVQDAHPVEYGQVLYRVDPHG
jgi:acetyl-CoA carboxylase biotin carboxyl carrier protein